MQTTAHAGTVLVVEDDEAIADQVVGVLETAGYTVFHAGDGATALRVLETIKVDLMLLDLVLPSMNGWELLEECERRQLQSWASIVLFSAYRDAIARVDPGAYHGRLEKPLSVRDLVATAQRHVLEAVERRRPA